MHTDVRRSVQEVTENAMRSLPHTSILAVAVSDYDHLASLGGPAQDYELMREIFDRNPQVEVHHERFTGLRNPTAQEFRSSVLEHASARMAPGDILILYFSGRGAISGRNRFYFCLRDAVASERQGGVLRLSAVSFSDILQTLAATGVRPVFILDLCFGGQLGPQEIGSVISAMQDSLHRYHAGAYALVAASRTDKAAFETEFGGVFTRGLHSIVLNGLEDEVSRHMPLLTLEGLRRSLQDKLDQDGWPLSRFYIAPDLPVTPIASNVKFQHTRESFAPYMKRIVAYLWNEGQPVEADISEFIEHLGPGAYANHSKLSLAPWDLLQDGEEPGTRKLTDRGRGFAAGELEIPRKIVRDPETWKWVAEAGTEYVSIVEV